MADFMVLIAAFSIMAAFFSLFALIFNLGVLERRAMSGDAIRSPLDIKEQPKIGVQNPFIVKVLEDKSYEDGLMAIMLHSSVPCYLTFFWGVTVKSIEESLCKEEPCNEESEEEHEHQFIPVYRILSGSYECKSAMNYYEPGQDHQIEERIPNEMLAKLEQSDDTRYQVLIVTEWSRGLDRHISEEIDPCEIVSLLSAIKCKQSASGVKTFAVEAQFIQIANGRIYPLKKLYVSLDDTDEPTNESPGRTSTCVVCHSMPVSRVLLPCRHACVCGLCFSKLNFKCPMCREWIQSYFLTEEEPELATNEFDTSRELHNMTVGEIIQGIFSST